MIRADRTSLIYEDHGRKVHACDKIDLEIRQGEFVGILGPSGSGKSSLLYLLSGLKSPTSGNVYWEGSPIHLRSDDERSYLRLREFGFVFQQPYLIGYLTALENVILSDPANWRHGVELLEEVGLSSNAHRRPHELSVGERQRVAVARALFSRPKVVFADEPTAALDHVTGERIVRLLNKRRGEGALVMVTHDPSMLGEADRVLHLVDGRLHENPSSQLPPR
ncbi:MAG: ATP-binding cassette domain-containing protein [Fimbriimonadaceae bacterium]|uniref:ABC transporter ATP-binding protein n=1 Tax=Candidatus Nitrosymbiomonas proteolyticus TaxID=2608984 RepID=A0A809S424_9BACT|nr:ATP-binding cassette domain-containing protein [Fimbriimonadaceae bacterium]NUM39483.1 ATP-binding cassette domain-containing protein [Armatimonadota bacterium]BBO23377.1 ABC transporter ATP-binding protein [Candidatus Nitrosymbiomonas proteolyticus]